jgi:hypothetical protein
MDARTSGFAKPCASAEIASPPGKQPGAPLFSFMSLEDGFRVDRMTPCVIRPAAFLPMPPGFPAGNTRFHWACVEMHKI